MTTLWFDLEATLVESWDNPISINDEKILDILLEFPCDSIGIFSFAIWDDADRESFIHRFKPHIESRFGIEISHIPTKRELFEVIRKRSGKSFDWADFFDFWNKERGFSDWIRATNSGVHILVDDMVEDCEMRFKDCHIIMLHI